MNRDAILEVKHLVQPCANAVLKDIDFVAYPKDVTIIGSGSAIHTASLHQPLRHRPPGMWYFCGDSVGG